MKKLLPILVVLILAFLPTTAEARRIVTIEHSFTVYQEPSAASPVLSRFGAQDVTVLDEGGGGWLLVSTHLGPGWTQVNTAEPAPMAAQAIAASSAPHTTAHSRWQLNIPHSFTVYREPDFRSQEMGRFDAQEVTVHEEAAWGWVLISTHLGRGWVNMRLEPLQDTIAEFTSQFGSNVAIFYKNLDTGFLHMHNPDRIFFAASLSKMNHALYVYTLAERGYISMDEVHIYRSADQWGGTGTMRFMPFGTEFTTRELLAQSIVESDNAAYRMMVRHTSHAPLSYQDFAREIGANTRFVLDVVSQNTSARDAGLWMYNIWQYLNSGGRYAHYFEYDLKNTAQTSHPHWTRGTGSLIVDGRVCLVMMQPSYPIARKYGWYNRVFHEAAIIYAPSPYILIVLSNTGAAEYEMFYNISQFFEGINRRWFDAP